MLECKISPDYEALLSNLRREGTPKRVHYIELFWDEEISEGSDIRSSHSTSQLIELREPHLVRAVDDDRVGIRNVEPRLDDRCA